MNNPLFGKTVMRKVEHNRAKPASFIIPASGVQHKDGTVEFDV